MPLSALTGRGRALLAWRPPLWSPRRAAAFTALQAQAAQLQRERDQAQQ